MVKSTEPIDITKQPYQIILQIWNGKLEMISHATLKLFVLLK